MLGWHDAVELIRRNRKLFIPIVEWLVARAAEGLDKAGDAIELRIKVQRRLNDGAQAYDFISINLGDDLASAKERLDAAKGKKPEAKPEPKKVTVNELPAQKAIELVRTIDSLDEILLQGQAEAGDKARKAVMNVMHMRSLELLDGYDDALEVLFGEDSKDVEDADG